jgi:1-acyl-sn-glycerol-3-phosphate acyltransferase
VKDTVGLFAEHEQLILAIAPEGTRSTVDRWKTGFYFVAVEAEVPIVPIALDYRRRLVRIGERFDPAGDLGADLADLQQFYRGVAGKRTS